MPIEIPLTPDEGFFWILCIGSFPMFLSGVSVVTGACFAMGPGSLHSGGKRTILSIALMTGWQYYVFMYLHHYPRLTGCTQGLGCLLENPFSASASIASEAEAWQEWPLLFYHICMAMWLWSWLTAIKATPVCPLRTSELAEGYARSAEEGDAVRQRHRQAGCRSCREIGGGSVPGFDHYCPLIGNAVGRANRKPFILTLVYQMLSAVVLLGDGVPYAIDALSRSKGLWSDAKDAQVLVGVILSLHINTVCLFLLCTQLLVLPLGISSVELWNFCPWLWDSQVLVAQRGVSFPRLSHVTRELGPVYRWLIPV
eukprot:TRINITY_DN33242_c0_g2_i1.p2 TRINITY_DN33242_c0_g2~~TRINITY_DN33242_c0_g2_i1.p2  ORF type:complete len:312 (+),score=87.86 TRINITY_DN33242_c0_g2_i1:122-1057(+)